MLENTNIWTHGPMDLFLNNKPAHVYVPDTNVKATYENLQSRLSEQGSIPIGIDHLADNIIESNGILAKMDLLNVGNITQIEYADDAIKIVEAELTNPIIRDLYENGELEMVSIVADSTTSECPKDYDYIVDTTDITRVDIVEKGACPTCNIPKPTDSSETVVYARYSIENNMEDEIMAEDALTAEAVQEIINTALNPIKEQLDKQDKRLEALESSADDSKPEEGEEETEEVKAMKAEIEALKAEKAEAQVDSLIAQGKITPAMKEASVKICAMDSKAFDEMYKDAPVIVDLDERQSMHAGDSGDSDESEPDEDDKLIAEMEAAFAKGE